MLRPKISINRRISFASEITGAFFTSFIMAFVSAIFILSSFNFFSSSPGVEKTRGEAPGSDTERGLVLETQELSDSNPRLTPSPTPSQAPTPTLTPTTAFLPATPALTFTPTPTTTLQISQPPEFNGGSLAPPPASVPSPIGGYSGPPLSPAPEKKDLFILSDSLPEDWVVEQNEGTDFVPGEMGQALSLGTGKLVLSGGEVFANAGTLSFWLKLGSDAPNGEAPIIDWNFSGDNYSPSLFEISIAQGELLFSVYDETTNQDDISSPFESPLEWHFVVVTWDLTEQPYERVLFIDGKKVASGGFPFAPNTRHPSIFQIGGTLGGRHPVPFVIDELVLTNWARNKEEITGGQ